MKYKNLLTTLLLACTAGVASVYAADTQPDTEEQEAERWFEVEVVLFKSTRNEQQFDESWDKKAGIQLDQPLIDFLQPYQFIKSDFDPSSLPTRLRNQLEQLTSMESVSKEDTVAPTTHLTNVEIPEATQDLVAYKVLPESLNQLDNEATSLARHPDYRLLSHMTWRQPMVSEDEAPAIRIAGGQDFSLQFDYQGNQLNGQFISDHQTMDMTPQEVGVQSNDAMTEVISPVDSSGEQTKETLSLEPAVDMLVENLWVPELDGDITIYLNHYLHIKTNLYLRIAGQEEVEAIDIAMLNNEFSQNLTANDPFGPQASSQNTPTAPPFGETPQSESQNISSSATPIFPNEPNAKLTNKPNTANFASLDEKHQFSWEIGDDFLRADSEKIYIDKLFNYPMQQSRRVRSNELHYFDHPLFGMLIMIRPIEETESSQELDLPPSI